ncbi:hypothetical protein U8V97_15180 [Priestia filamentosa]|uniref:hypothetical protein n=1 Tax=Priestia filamentosa TaxID=1402861 RepID=UPI00397A611E
MRFYPLTENHLISIDPVELVELEKRTIRKEKLDDFSEELLRSSIYKWSIAIDKTMGKEMVLGLKLADKFKEPHEIYFNKEGLINEFVRLKTPEDITSFAQKYGLLGIKAPDIEQITSTYPVVQYLMRPSYIFTGYDFSVFEPIDLWIWHIKEVRQIFKLYNVVKKKSSDEQVNELIEIKIHKGRLEDHLYEDGDILNSFFVHWTSGEQILKLPQLLEEQSLLEIGRYTLIKMLESRLFGGVHEGGIYTIGIHSGNKAFKVRERKYAVSLLAAIYYDLWKKIVDDINIYFCGNIKCGLPFVKSGRQKYCSDACKQEAYRIRHKEKERKDK